MMKRGMAYSALLGMMAVLAQPVMAEEEAGTAGATAPASTGDAARDALTKKADDASSEKNLEEVFQASENQYSLLKKGKIALNYDVDYSFYRDSRIDIAVDGSSSQITRFRIEEDAQHTVTNSIDMTYGVRNNLTFSLSLPLVAKFDTQSDLNTTGLGDVSLGCAGSRCH
jgi:hypothetical protein